MRYQGSVERSRINGLIARRKRAPALALDSSGWQLCAALAAAFALYYAVKRHFDPVRTVLYVTPADPPPKPSGS